MRILGLGICGPGEAGKYLTRTLDSMSKLCDDVLIVSNNTDAKTEKMLVQYPRHIVTYRDDREWGKYQPEIKREAVTHALSFNPDWILMLDMDEELGPRLTRERLEALAAQDEVAWRFFFVQKWNDEDSIKPDLGFWDLRFWKNLPEMGYEFEPKPVHCGMGPRWAYQYAFDAPYIVIHRGLMDPAVRQAKVARYEKYDPKQQYCSPEYYAVLGADLPGVPFDVAEWEEKVASSVAEYAPTRVRPQLVKPIIMKMYRILRLADGEVLEIPERDLHDTINQGGKERNFKLLGEVEVGERTAPEAPVIPAKVPNEFECAVCGFVAKSKLGLNAHARKHEPRENRTA